MLARVAKVVLLTFAACATATAPPGEPSPPAASAPQTQVDHVIRDLAEFTTVEAMRTHLEAGLEAKELHFVGFGDVTVAQRVDGVIAAVQDSRQRPDDRLAREKVSHAVAAWLDAMREAAVRRSVGRASCLPFLR